MYLGGVSRGAGVALKFALTEKCPVHNCIALCPAVPAIDANDIPIVNNPLKVFFILGSEDHATNQAVEKLRQTLRDRGIRQKVLVVRGLGHAIPGNLSEYTEAGLQFIGSE